MKLNAHSTLLPPPSLSVGLGEFYSTLLTLCATLMIIKHFVVVTESHWHILWPDIALLLPLLLFKLCPILTSSEQIKYISTWLGNVNIDLFARNLVRCVFCGWQGRRLMVLCWCRYGYTLFWLFRRVEPNAGLFCMSNTTSNCIRMCLISFVAFN